jgi:hypothetical protein
MAISIAEMNLICPWCEASLSAQVGVFKTLFRQCLFLEYVYILLQSKHASLRVFREDNIKLKHSFKVDRVLRSKSLLTLLAERNITRTLY